MPAIREESNQKTNRIPVHIIPPGAKPPGLLQRSMIIQTLPEEPSKPKVTPSNRYHDSVEQVVADYLHFSKYGKTLPVTRGYASLACPCCNDRNRENMQRQRDRFRAPPAEPDPEKLPEALASPPEPNPNPRPIEDVPYLSPRRYLQPTQSDLRNFPASWMDYQPMPYAQTYLNPEFNRAAMLQRYEEDRKQYHDDASMKYISGRVLDANTKYDLAMKKLERSLNNFSVSREESDLSY
ncbi:hypothetical protein ACOMHN_051325 [Nucella lapillus]